MHLFCLDPALRGALQGGGDVDEAAGDGGSMLASGVNMLAEVMNGMSDAAARSITSVSLPTGGAPSHIVIVPARPGAPTAAAAAAAAASTSGDADGGTAVLPGGVRAAHDAVRMLAVTETGYSYEYSVSGLLSPSGEWPHLSGPNLNPTRLCRRLAGLPVWRALVELREVETPGRWFAEPIWCGMRGDRGA